jgi:hypothetical protein
VFRFLVLAFAAIFRPRALLIAENLCLRQQLLVLQRRHPRPRLSNADRRFWILASRWFGGWRDLLLIAKPATVLGWQRRGWRAYWTWRSARRAKGGRPAIPSEPQALIRRMAVENRLCGQKRIQAELARVESRRGGRGRDASCPAPPAQVPACVFLAPGSYRRSDAIGIRGLAAQSSSDA